MTRPPGCPDPQPHLTRLGKWQVMIKCTPGALEIHLIAYHNLELYIRR